MPRRDQSELARVLPRLRHDFETSRRLVTRAVERATRLADEAVATRRLIATRASRDEAVPTAEIWDAAARQLVRVARERDRELGVVAHELRQSLTAALAADRLLTVTPNLDAAQHARAVLSRQLLHLSQLVDSLLDYSRVSLNATVAQGRVNIVDVVNAAIETVGAAAAEREQQVRLHHDGSPAAILGDAVRLRQAMINLLHNAVRYTAERGRIDVTVSTNDSNVEVTVRDTGEGIDRVRLDTIFDPFVRASGSGPGLGIGLALVKRIAELHGGSITAASDGPGRGSVFTLTVPALEQTDGR